MPRRPRKSDRDGDDFYRPTREYKKFQESEEEESEKLLYERLAEKFSNYYTFDLESVPGFSNYVEGFEEDVRVGRMDVDQQQVGSMLLLPLLLLVPAAVLATFFLSNALTLFLWSIPFVWSYWVLTYPGLRATITRIRSSDEALRVVLYVAMHLEMNPNLVDAIESAAGHTSGYLSRDLSKIIWDTQTQQFDNVRGALSEHMQLWREWSRGFVKSMEYLLDSLSRRGDDKMRMIQNAQTEMIDYVKNQMDQYARDLSSPIRVLNMAGIMLPLMGLIMFPLVTIFLSGGETGIGGLTLYIGFVYLIILPLFLFFLVKRLISKRPAAYSQPSLEQVDDIPPRDKIVIERSGARYILPLKKTAFAVGLVVALPGLVFYGDLISTIIQYEASIEIASNAVTTSSEWSNFIESQYAVEAARANILQAMTLFWGINAGLITYFAGRSYGRMKIRERINRIEADISIGLTELENALSKGQPIERAVYTVIQKYEEIGEGENPMRDFFAETMNNMEEKGFPFRKAVFDDREGSIDNYPSSILENSMEIVANSVPKGPRITARNLVRMNEYIENQREVEETIKRLLDETVSQMKIQSRFIAPIITAAAASMSVVIVETLFQISERLERLQESLTIGMGNSAESLTQNMALIKNLDSSLPPTLVLLIVSLYLIEVSLILAYFTNGIQNGFDEINRDMEISRTLIYSATIFSLVVLVVAVAVLPMMEGLVK